MKVTPQVITVAIEPRSAIDIAQDMLDAPISADLLARAETLIAQIERKALASQQPPEPEDTTALSVAHQIAAQCRAAGFWRTPR